ncbi:MAG: hypothetical protein E6G97_10710 [Alphaproteobacteria bacterium]|nr:MAG: hypothetical protein E6G97_10710 [Alphaproteobacteria bacterium]
MARSIQVVACLTLAIAVPATAQTFGFSLGSAPRACLAIGDTTYRVAATTSAADLTVRIDPRAAAPDIRIALAATADEADFVFVDDGDAPPACNGTRARSVKLDAAAASPDLVVGFSSANSADYRIYVRSRWLGAEAVAALFAAAHAPARKLVSRIVDRSN